DNWLTTGAPVLPPLDVRWQGRMRFDGETIRFEKLVEASGQTQRLLTETLAARLSRRVNFAAASHARDETTLAGIECQGGVFFENRTTDAEGLASIEWIQTRDLKIDHVTGDLLAHGPGWLRTVRRGGTDPLAAGNPLAKQNASMARRERPGPPELALLHVDFQRSVTGNVHAREMFLADRVRAVYGPISDWQAAAPSGDQRRLGERDVVMTCDRLGIAQVERDYGWKRQPVELEATGNAQVEGTGFTASADRITYAQSKDLLVLDGTGRSDAELTRQTEVGGPVSRTNARKILYWRTEGRVELDDWKFLNVGAGGPLNGGPSTPPDRAPRRGE
ncbi:MAG: hypothetical protein WD468_05740, partial [Pirellulales bacterium]